jgi:hypothetical protein
MKRQAMVLAAAFLLVAGVAAAYGQASFDVPFPFRAGAQKLPAGAYLLSKADDGSLVLKQVSSGKETPVAVLERIKPEAPLAGPKLVFDEVGDFAPSYTEYVTVYVLSGAWLPGEDGYRVHVTKGAHKTKEVAGLPVKR